MTDLEDFTVKDPYSPSEDEKQAIAELEAKGIVSSDWESGKKGIKSFKENLRKDMYNKQNKLCAFCRIHIPLACVPLHREHIVYKNAHPQWMFKPENLCVSCPSCNEYKAKTEVLVNPKTKTYPKSSKGFKIIHPLYDRYSDHIELIGGILYHGITTKGIFTINTCKLSRVELAQERADQKMYVEKKGDIIAEIVHLLSVSSQYVDDNNKFRDYVRDIVTKYKEKQINGV